MLELGCWPPRRITEHVCLARWMAPVADSKGDKSDKEERGGKASSRSKDGRASRTGDSRGTTGSGTAGPAAGAVWGAGLVKLDAATLRQLGALDLKTRKLAVQWTEFACECSMSCFQVGVTKY